MFIKPTDFICVASALYKWKCASQRHSKCLGRNHRTSPRIRVIGTRKPPLFFSTDDRKSNKSWFPVSWSSQAFSKLIVIRRLQLANDLAIVLRRSTIKFRIQLKEAVNRWTTISQLISSNLPGRRSHWSLTEFQPVYSVNSTIHW